MHQSIGMLSLLQGQLKPCAQVKPHSLFELSLLECQLSQLKRPLKIYAHWNS